MNSIATLGMFTDIRGGAIISGGGAIIKKEIIKPKIIVHSLEIKNQIRDKDKDFITIKLVE